MLFTDLKNMPNGANFVNVDLHIHSFGASTDVKDPSMTPSAIVEAAVNQGLAVIALTDHNTDRNVAEALTQASKYAGRLLVLPGVEVTTAHGHLLVYFAPEAVGKLNDFIGRLSLKGERGAEGTHTAMSMADVIGLADGMGGLSVAAHIDRDKTGFEKFAPGYQAWKADIVTSRGVYGLEFDEVANLNWYSESDNDPTSGGERKKLYGRRKAIPELKGRRELARLQGSDAHRLAEFASTSPDKKWTRVKLTELTFEAVRTALVDPTARVVARASVPTAIPRIRGMAITGGFLDGQKIHFSDNLNCFIGGRGTGKSTAVRTLAHCFGCYEEFRNNDGCPDSMVVLCEDANGVRYRYERARHGETMVNTKDGGVLVPVPADSFSIEYIGQGELAEIAKNPLDNPQLFQDFLDRHTVLGDLAEREEELVGKLRENATRLETLEGTYGQLGGKKKTLGEIGAKLKAAEDGNLKGVVKDQTQLSSERTLRESIESIATTYSAGVDLSQFEMDYAAFAEAAGELTADSVSIKLFKEIRGVIEETNLALKVKANEINATMKGKADELVKKCADLKTNHAKLDGEIAPKLADLASKGLRGGIADLNRLLKEKETVAGQVAAIERVKVPLEQARTERATLLKELTETRDGMTARRKAQLEGINRNLSQTLDDYMVFVRYIPEGITDEFSEYLRRKLTGTHVHDTSIDQICAALTPAGLSALVWKGDVATIAERSGITSEAARSVQAKLFTWAAIFELQVLAKPPKPVIVVRTKGVPARDIDVLDLSDGQRHTILLTIAMVADVNIPLVIDQPEDDLDNAFISSTVVGTLRRVKERRQVILVTHNANIAVLGDSELILPMKRENDGGKVNDRGSIDAGSIKNAVQTILEGGEEAFNRRRQIYSH